MHARLSEHAQLQSPDWYDPAHWHVVFCCVLATCIEVQAPDWQRPGKTRASHVGCPPANSAGVRKCSCAWGT